MAYTSGNVVYATIALNEINAINEIPNHVDSGHIPATERTAPRDPAADT
jgi:hypothetical protein